MNLFEQIQYSQNWNICFCTLSEEELIANKGIDGVQWLKHPYKDRWFADPFICNGKRNHSFCRGTNDRET